MRETQALPRDGFLIPPLEKGRVASRSSGEPGGVRHPSDDPDPPRFAWLPSPLQGEG